MYLHVYIHIHENLCVYIYMYIRACMHECMYLCIYVVCMCVCTYIYIYTCMCICKCICRCICLYIHIKLFIRTHVIHLYIYIYISFSPALQMRSFASFAEGKLHPVSSLLEPGPFTETLLQWFEDEVCRSLSLSLCISVDSAQIKAASKAKQCADIVTFRAAIRKSREPRTLHQLHRNQSDMKAWLQLLEATAVTVAHHDTIPGRRRDVNNLQVTRGLQQ